MALVLTPLLGIPLVEAGDDLTAFLRDAVLRTGVQPVTGDIFVLAQKIVSKAEGRLVNLSQVLPSQEARDLALRSEKDPRFVELVLRESNLVLRTRPGTIIVEHKLGFVCANAGIDHSNVQGSDGAPEDWVLLLPEDPDRSADLLRHKLEDIYQAVLGVAIIDSHGRAWRNGITGTTIGLSGVPGLVDMRGKPDLFGYKLRITQIAVADELAAAASLMMGQADEGLPAIHVRGFPYPLRESSSGELLRPKEQDMFR
ncbi:MAG: coenzyme F420-0:L-glutamate ligase [Chloroflexi bacterium]|nr:coenzyme F420-0:L-glutamate ligase [Chloroflexota bacterium]